MTFSTRSVDNISDVIAALNISTSASIKYGTIGGNAGAGFANEGKVLTSQLNYVISVKVNNEAPVRQQQMVFQELEGLDPKRFTDVYGDCFISAFLEGGEFNAVVSIKVDGKDKISKVKAEADVQLAVGPPPLSIGASGKLDKERSSELDNTEITLSVNWSGGGELKGDDEVWSLATIVKVANAFPSKVAQHSSKTAALLTRYETLLSFQRWKIKNSADKEWKKKFKILDYTPCALYTADLFDAYLSYKTLWKHIGMSAFLDIYN